MCSTCRIQTSLWMGCPIRILKAHRLYAAPPERFAGLRVLLRLSAPRHPPRTLCSLLCIHILTFSSPLHLRKEETMVEHVRPLLLFCSALFSAKLKLCCMELSKYLRFVCVHHIGFLRCLRSIPHFLRSVNTFFPMFLKDCEN